MSGPRNLGELFAILEAINRREGRVVHTEAPDAEIPEPWQPKPGEEPKEPERPSRTKARPVEQQRLPYRDD